MYKVKKIYYDNVSGEHLYNASYGYHVPIDFDRDCETLLALKERDKSSIGLLILENGQYAQDFQEGRLIGVNVETKVPIFEYLNSSNSDEPIIPSKPLSEQILELKEEQVIAKRLLSDSYSEQQSLIELLIDMGVL